MKVAKIEEHLTDNDLNDLIKEHKDSYNIYRRAYLIKMVKNGEIYLSKFSFYIYISDNYFELQNIYTYTCV